jgi:putative Ca2+/H+ antiporter (TMEM165/GDT1 family)
VSSILAALGVVFLAELGDKSQLLAVSLAARRAAGQVLAGLALAAVVLQGLSAGFGALLADAIPTRAVAVVAGVGFLVAAVLVPRGDDATAEVVTVRPRRTTVLIAFSSLLVAELGDKTMLATAALAAQQPALLVWLGGTAGFVAADAVAVVVGVRLFRRVPLSALRRGTAALFAAVGVLALLGAL